MPHSSSRTRKLNRAQSRFNILRKGISHFSWRDFYHLLLTLDWSWFFAAIAVGYIAVNTTFALLYLAGGDCIENARPGSFWDAFFFSVQTMASIGYGAMHPRPECTYTNVLVTIEALFGLMGLTTATGLMFARFSRPTARVLFSHLAVIAPHNGVPTFIFRAANERRNRILAAQLSVTLLRNEVTVEGEFMRRFYDLELSRSRTPSFALTWTAMHPIDKNSPLYGATPESLAEAETSIIVTLTGIDETVSQTIHARHVYTEEDILWNYRFVDVLSNKRDGRLLVNYTHFHDVVPIDQ